MRMLIYRALLLLGMAACGYVAVSTFAFQFRHPELTDTQRLLRIGDALLWR